MPGKTGLGEKVAVEPDGRLVTDRLTGWLKPPAPITCTVDEIVWPEQMTKELGLDVKLNDCGGDVTVILMLFIS